MVICYNSKNSMAYGAAKVAYTYGSYLLSGVEVEMSAYTIGFLKHSGFYLELDDCILVFDYYQDPEGILDSLLADTVKDVYFFVSHRHYDHFNPEIAKFQNKAKSYFLHRDCEFSIEDMDKVHFLNVGDSHHAKHFSVRMYGSTDIGGAYLIQYKNRNIFHAGDLNWWHWSGESDRDNMAARAFYFRELKRLKGLETDILFFPVDARQGEAREWGVRQFMETGTVKQLLVPMHAFGPAWKRSYAFRWRFPNVPVWIPQHDGEKYKGELV